MLPSSISAATSLGLVCSRASSGCACGAQHLRSARACLRGGGRLAAAGRAGDELSAGRAGAVQQIASQAAHHQHHHNRGVHLHIGPARGLLRGLILHRKLFSLQWQRSWRGCILCARVRTAQLDIIIPPRAVPPPSCDAAYGDSLACQRVACRRRACDQLHLSAFRIRALRRMLYHSVPA